MPWDVHYVAETGSTNADLAALARSGAGPGRVLWAGYQTAGRGRLGRTWEAPPGSSLLASILLPVEDVPFLVMARVALAAADACARLSGLEVTLKWPNDLLVGDRKLAGLLAETEAGSPTVVVGIGCNLGWPPAARPPDLADQVAALSDGPSGPPGPSVLLDALLDGLTGWLLRPEGEVLNAYRARCATLGHPVEVQLAEGTLAGRAAGITATGALEVATTTGARVVHAGDVVHVRAD